MSENLVEIDIEFYKNEYHKLKEENESLNKQLEILRKENEKLIYDSKYHKVFNMTTDEINKIKDELFEMYTKYLNNINEYNTKTAEMNERMNKLCEGYINYNEINNIYKKYKEYTEKIYTQVIYTKAQLDKLVNKYAYSLYINNDLLDQIFFNLYKTSQYKLVFNNKICEFNDIINDIICYIKTNKNISDEFIIHIYMIYKKYNSLKIN